MLAAMASVGILELVLFGFLGLGPAAVLGVLLTFLASASPAQPAPHLERALHVAPPASHVAPATTPRVPSC